ncbi:MAG: hypothetical protein PF630_12135 [Gammaproteobacteria bacterium]|nr:hypothetical protein [Gammaproteobacteria bacterium]
MNMQQNIDDQMLSAWLDNALDASTCKLVDATLEHNPELQQRLLAMLRNERKLQQHYNSMAQQPVSAGLQSLLQVDAQGNAYQGKAKSRNWAMAATAKPGWLLTPIMEFLSSLTTHPIMSAAAVTVAMALGLMLGQQAEHSLSSNKHSMPMALLSLEPANPIQDFLQTAVAGKTQQIAAGRKAVVDMTFRNSDGHYCRQFRVYDTVESIGNIAVACHLDNNWQLQLAQTSRSSIADSGHYMAASGPETALIDSYILQQSDGEILLGEQETELIKNRWTSTAEIQNKP